MLDIRDKGFFLVERASDVTVEEIQLATDGNLEVPPNFNKTVAV